MPEGPEVETVKRSLEPRVVGRRLGEAWVSPYALRRRVEERALSRLVGRKIVALGRHGKLLWLDVEGGGGLMVRLGMTGRLLVEKKRAPRHPHTHVVFSLDEGASELRYVDVRRFGEVVPFASRRDLDEERARMGPDPLTWTEEERQVVIERLKRTTRSLKDALLDQTLVAGVGNIYASEACFEARLLPTRRGARVAKKDLDRLTQAVRVVLERAVQHCGTTFSSFVDGSGRPGGNLAHLKVFMREKERCVRCGGTVRRIVQGGRSTFLCRGCQR